MVGRTASGDSAGSHDSGLRKPSTAAVPAKNKKKVSQPHPPHLPPFPILNCSNRVGHPPHSPPLLIKKGVAFGASSSGSALKSTSFGRAGNPLRQTEDTQDTEVTFRESVDIQGHQKRSPKISFGAGTGTQKSKGRKVWAGAKRQHTYCHQKYSSHRFAPCGYCLPT